MVIGIFAALINWYLVWLQYYHALCFLIGWLPQKKETEWYGYTEVQQNKNYLQSKGHLGGMRYLRLKVRLYTVYNIKKITSYISHHFLYTWNGTRKRRIIRNVIKAHLIRKWKSRASKSKFDIPYWCRKPNILYDTCNYKLLLWNNMYCLTEVNI